MKVKNSLFPYPVLNNKSYISSFKKSTYAFNYDEVQDEEFYYLKNVSVELDNVELKKLIGEDKVGIALVVECSSTIYRKSFEISLEPTDIKIPIGDLRGPVEISCFLYAREDLLGYQSDDFNEIYSGYRFNIDKYDILAADDGYNTKVTFDESLDDKISSIFVVIPDAYIDAKTMDVDIKRENIKITIPQKEYGYYSNMKNDKTYQNIFFSLIAIPALNYALTKIQVEDFENSRLKYDWLESVIVAYKKVYDRELSDDWGKLEFDVAQRLLNDAVAKSIDDFYFFMIDQYVRSDIDE